VYYPNVLPASFAAALLDHLTRAVAWRRETDRYGVQGRDTYYCGDNDAVFSYVGLTLPPQPWLPALLHVRRALEANVLPKAVQRLDASRDQPRAAGSSDCSSARSDGAGAGAAAAAPRGETLALAGCLLNRYGAGEGSIPWHSDEVRAHGAFKFVASVSLGGPRPFLLRRKALSTGADGGGGGGDNGAPESMEVLLESGSVLLMAGATQEHFEHSLLLSVDAPPRISLTFRTIVPGFERGWKG
jgi:hypothetical protein